jgi:hypothetical protein
MTAHALTLLTTLAEGGENAHENMNPVLNGVATFVVLLLLLFVTTRFNRDR